jgi:ribosomal protein S18 acetylase RimI-like enzyme
MTIRRADASDATSLAALYETVWSSEIGILGERLTKERCPDADTVRNWLEQDLYFVIEEQGKIAAAIGCETRHGTLHLVHLVTHPGYRRRGFAEALMNRAEEYARETGAVKLWFDSAPELKAAHELYLKLDYSLCGRLKAHYWGTDIVLYEKML